MSVHPLCRGRVRLSADLILDPVSISLWIEGIERPERHGFDGDRAGFDLPVVDEILGSSASATREAQARVALCAAQRPTRLQKEFIGDILAYEFKLRYSLSSVHRNVT